MVQKHKSPKHVKAGKKAWATRRKKYGKDGVKG